MSVFLVVGAVFSQVVNCLSVDVVIFRVFKDFIQLFGWGVAKIAVQAVDFCTSKVVWVVVKGFLNILYKYIL